jgi:hypothetical protein
MQQVDPLARTLSIIAILVASGGLWLSLHTYLRGGARVKVSAEKKLQNQSWDFISQAMLTHDELFVTVSSTGLSKAQVTNVFYELKKLPPFVGVEPSGRTLPAGIEGLHREVWIFSLSSIVSAAELNGKGVMKVRAGVTLGDGRTRRSRWLSLSAAEVTQR